MERNPLPTLLALCLLAGASLAQPSQHEFTPLSALWKRFSHEDGRFKVLLPGEPNETASVIENWFGRFERIDRHDITLQIGLAKYVVSYADLPSNLIAPKEAKQFLNSVRDTEVTRLKGKLSSERETSIAGHPCRELSVVSENESFRMKFCLVERRLYQLGVTIPAISETPDPKSAEYPPQFSPQELKKLQDVMTTDFFNSFNLLPVAPPPGATPSPQAPPPPKEILVRGGVMQGAALKRVAPSVITHGLELSRNGRTGAPIKSASAWKTALPLCLAVAMMV